MNLYHFNGPLVFDNTANITSIPGNLVINSPGNINAYGVYGNLNVGTLNITGITARVPNNALTPPFRMYRQTGTVAGNIINASITGNITGFFGLIGNASGTLTQLIVSPNSNITSTNVDPTGHNLSIVGTNITGQPYDLTIRYI